MNNKKKSLKEKNGDFNPHHIPRKDTPAPSKRNAEKEGDNDFHHPHPFHSDKHTKKE